MTAYYDFMTVHTARRNGFDCDDENSVAMLHYIGEGVPERGWCSDDSDLWSQYGQAHDTGHYPAYIRRYCGAITERDEFYLWTGSRFDKYVRDEPYPSDTFSKVRDDRPASVTIIEMILTDDNGNESHFSAKKVNGRWVGTQLDVGPNDDPEEYTFWQRIADRVT